MGYRGTAKKLGRFVPGALSCALVLTVAGCGTRMTDTEIQRDAGQAPAPVVETIAGDPGAPPADAGPAIGATQPNPAASAAGVPVTSGAAPAKPTDKSAPATPTTQGKPGAVKPTGGAAAPCAQKLSPIQIGQSGVFSGVLGPVFYGNKIGLAAWAAEVNAAGGVQCHPIALTQMDDGGDPAKVTSNTQYLINTKKVVAIVAPIQVIALPAMLRVANPAGVPVMGGDGVAPEWFTDPNAFMHGPGVIASLTGGLKSAIESTAKKKVGMLYCVEASICSLMKQSFTGMAEKSGGQTTTATPYSLTQPNFTSECQSLKSNGTEIVIFGGDGASLQRFYSSCAALGYSPAAVTSGIAVTAAQAKDPILRKAGVYLGVSNTSFTATQIPAVAKWRATMARFAPTEEAGQAALISYAGGKMFEAALARVFEEARAGDVTKEMVLKGVYALDGDNLNGLSPAGLRFKKGQATPSPSCYFTLQIGADGYTDRANGKAQCL